MKQPLLRTFAGPALLLAAFGCGQRAINSDERLNSFFDRDVAACSAEMGMETPKHSELRSYLYAWPDASKPGSFREIVVLQTNSEGKVLQWLRQTSREDLPQVGFPTRPGAVRSASPSE